MYSSQATYGDMSMHLSFLTSLANQGDFPPDYSLLPGTRLSYPFLSDSISASLYQLGAPLWFAYQLPMWAAGAQVLFGLYAFFSAMTESRAQAALAWVFFAFNGGFGFFYFLGGGVENFTRIFTAFYETPTNLVGENIRWVNVLVDMMLPQRATLFGVGGAVPGAVFAVPGGLPGAAAVLFPGGPYGRRLAHDSHPLLPGLGPGVRGVAGSLAAGAPLLGGSCRPGGQAAAGGRPGGAGFVQGAFPGQGGQPPVPGCRRGGAGAVPALAGPFGGGGFPPPPGREALLPWGVLLAVSLALAFAPAVCVDLPAGGGGRLPPGTPGLGHRGGELPVLYLQNLGLAGLLALGGLFLSRGGAFLRLAPALAIWLLAELVVFQPNVYDNNKLLYPAYAFLCCAAARCACRVLGLLRSRRARAGAAAGVVAVASFSAVLTMGREAVAPLPAFRHRGRGAGPVGGGQHRPRVGHPHRHTPQQRNRRPGRAQCGVRLPVLPLLPRPAL